MSLRKSFNDNHSIFRTVEDELNGIFGEPVCTASAVATRSTRSAALHAVVTPILMQARTRYRGARSRLSRPPSPATRGTSGLGKGKSLRDQRLDLLLLKGRSGPIETMGVKLIGSTSLYVTATLDGGLIIEQDVIRVSHRDQVEDLIQKGRDLERVVL